MIRNIIFDIGKVLVSYEPDAYMDRLGLDEKAKAAINQAMFQNKLWDESDQGLGTPEEFLQKFIAGAPEYAEEITKIHQTVGETVEKAVAMVVGHPVHVTGCGRTDAVCHGMDTGSESQRVSCVHYLELCREYVQSDEG